MSSPPNTSFFTSSVLEAKQSELNPDAPAFVPAWMITEPSTVRRVDDVMKTFHHLASVNDTETLLAAQHWLGEDPSEWMANGADYTAQHEEQLEGFALDYEQHLRDGLYRPPNQPKGDTRGRARSRD